MEFIFDIILEIIIEPILKSYLFTMVRFSKENSNINKEKVKCFVIFECIVLILMLIIGGIMLFETGGESIIGKILFITSIVVSVGQILLGIVLHNKNKDI